MDPQTSTQVNTEIVHALYRSFRRYGENRMFLRKLIGANDMRFFMYAKRASLFHEKIQRLRLKRPRSMLHSIVSRVCIAYYTSSLTALRWYCSMHIKRFPLTAVVVSATCLCITKIYAEIWTAIREGQSNASAKRRQIVSVIEGMRQVDR